MDQRAGCIRFVMGAAFIALAGCDEPNQFQPPPPPNVIVQAPVIRDVTTFTEYTGRIVAFEEVDIRARVPGFLESVEFTEGQVVEKDQILFRIEADPYEAALAAANADLAQNQAAEGLAATTLPKPSSMRPRPRCSVRKRQFGTPRSISRTPRFEARSGGEPPGDL